MTIEEDTAPQPPPSRPDGPAVVLGGRYLLGARLGKGGMAEVFRARDTVLRRDVAVKVFHHNVEIPDAALRRTGEVTLLAGLSHPHLVTLFDAGHDDADSFDYLVMELVRGTTLVPRVPLPGDQVALLGAQLAEALAYVHERNIVHRDVKPANVLLDTAGTTAKLADFGVARLLDATALTVHGTTLGTPNYLSPEQATGEPVTGASDVYSLGLVLFEALTGARAYPGTGVEAAVARLHRDPQLPDWVEPRWRLLIAAMTARDPGSRPSAAAVAARLREWPADTGVTQVLPSGLTPPTVTTGALVATEHSGRRPALLAVCAGVIVAAVVLALLVSRGSSPDAPRGAASISNTSIAAAASHAAGSRAATSATPNYPNFPPLAGALGVQLRVLQAGLRDALPAGAPLLSGDLLAVTADARRSDPAAALTALARFSTDLGGVHSGGRLSAQQLDALRAEVAVVAMTLRHDLAAAGASASRAALLKASASAAARAQAAARASASSAARPPAATPPAGAAPGPAQTHVPPGQQKKSKSGKPTKPAKGHKP